MKRRKDSFATDRAKRLVKLEAAAWLQTGPRGNCNVDALHTQCHVGGGGVPSCRTRRPMITFLKTTGRTKRRSERVARKVSVDGAVGYGRCVVTSKTWSWDRFPAHRPLS